MASKNPEDDWNIYKTVINKNWSRFLSDLEPTTILDAFLETEYIDQVKYRDISELQVTSDKVRKILDLVTKKGPKGYTDFKECLKKSDQEHLASLLEKSEKELIKKQRKEDAKREPKPNAKTYVNLLQGTARQRESFTDMVKATKSDLMRIADEAVGENWKSISPYLDVDSITLARIKADNPTNLRKRKLSEMWSSAISHLGTEPLEENVTQGMTDVTQGMTDVSQGMYDLSVSDVGGKMGQTRRQGEDFSNPYHPDFSNVSYQTTRSSVPQNVNQSNSQTNEGNNMGEDTARADERKGKYGNDETDAQRLNSSNFSLPAANIIPKPAQSDTPKDALDEIIQIATNLKNNGKQTVTAEPVLTPNTSTIENQHKPPVEELDNTDGPEDPKCFEGQNEEKGRLKILDNKDIKCLQRFCCDEIGFGGFGKVYKSKGKMSGLDIYVVLKKIPVKENEDAKMKSITNERLASRTMHFAIVPLLAYGADDIKASEKVYYFISPYMEKGNLGYAIQNDTGCKSPPVLELRLRMKIMYHIASAIHFLHTPVKKFRGTILHMDIKSLNIVLDQWYNARLIDFGLAREMAEGCDSETATNTPLPHSKGYYPTITYDRLDVYADYYSFGVVIRELLTGMKPFVGGEPELRNWSSRKMRSKFMSLWKDDQNKPYPVAEQLLELSKACLDLKNKNIASEKILNKILGLLKDRLHDTWNTDSEWKKCDMCMRYNAVDDDILEHKCKMSVCVSCMRHSYCNPIVCHTCGEEIIPNIGYGWDAVLIAGNDVNDEALAEMFSKDVEDVKKVITSKCPLVMGISEERVLTVKPTSPGTSEYMKTSLTDQLKRCLSDIPEGKQNTLVLYFSGHYLQNYGFQLGNEKDFISIEELQKLLLGTENTASRCVRLVVFLDCCCAPGVQVDDFRHKQDDISVVQMNACPQISPIYADKTAGSIFQRFFTQALTRKALSAKCINANCKDCCIDNDFVTLGNLHVYVAKHYKGYDRELSKPKVYVYNADPEDVRIGYVVNFCVDLEFMFHFKDEEEQKKDVPHSMFSNIEELRTVLFDEYLKMRLPSSIRQGRQFCNTHLRDILIIFKKTGPKATQILELDTIEKVNMAWDSRRQLNVSLRDATNVGTGLVGAFFDETSVKTVVDYLFKKGTNTFGDENTVAFTTHFEDFSTFVREHKKLEDVNTVVEDLCDAKEKLEQTVNVTNLGVKFPYDESASPKNWANLLCFYLQVDSQDDRMQ